MTDNTSIANGRLFDLNIEEILDNWETYHAIREIIANAIDEQRLTKTKEIEIYQSPDGWWHIRDFGRGIQYANFTQNENKEKLDHKGIIGKFGIGLKDALATLNRKGIEAKIKSKYATFTTKIAPKANFSDVSTLHALMGPTEDPKMDGTDFCLKGCTEHDIKKAKSLFLVFSQDEVLEKTKKGEILKRKGATGNIYINGVKVNSEPDFLFSYNITAKSKKIDTALNRERANVSRSAYQTTIKEMLINAKSEEIWDILIDAFKQVSSGSSDYELRWKDVQLATANHLNDRNKNTVFVSVTKQFGERETLDQMKREGKDVILVPDDTLNNMEKKNADGKMSFSTTSTYLSAINENFVPEIVKSTDLTIEEQTVLKYIPRILDLIGGKPHQVKSIEISSKLFDNESRYHTVGLWRPKESQILIRRDQLKSVEALAGTLLHECAHARSGKSDVDRDFESELTTMIGKIANIAVNK